MTHRSILIVLAATAALAGCARLNERAYGTWLDTYGMPPVGSRQAVPEPQASELRAQIAQLQAQAETVRVKMSAEKDRVRRFAYLKQLRDIGDQQRPLDELLHFGPKPSLLAVPSPGDAGA
ncbi:MAG TPA: hypothetical protein VMZ74_05470 [Ramlibacter sp.]|nr:hypothetical protein [Ramlibacter sp.]